MTTFLWWLDALKPNLNGGEPVSQETKDIYSALWNRYNRDPQFMWCLKAAEGWV